MNDSERLDFVEQELLRYAKEPMKIVVWDSKVFTVHPLSDHIGGKTLREAIDARADYVPDKGQKCPTKIHKDGACCPACDHMTGKCIH